jgi:hypothetical protein
MNTIRGLVLVGTVLLSCACASTKGPPPIIHATGVPVSVNPDENVGLIKRFQDSASTAASSDASDAALTAMLDDGFGLVNAHCNDFFLSSGRDQSSLLVLGDVIASIGTLAASALAIRDRDATNDGDVLAIVTLGTSTALAGINIYTQRYLFGAENIDAVRELTLNALSAHRTQVKTLPPTTYQDVVMHLFDNQALCTPRRIAILAREAIQKGDVVPSEVGANALQGLADNRDQAILKTLGATLNPPGAVSADQAGALYWLFFEASSASERARIRQSLAGIPEANNPFGADGKLKDPIPHKAQIETALASLSARSRSAFDAQIKAAKSGGNEESAAAGPLPDFELAPARMPRGARVTVGVD